MSERAAKHPPVCSDESLSLFSFRHKAWGNIKSNTERERIYCDFLAVRRSLEVLHPREAAGHERTWRIRFWVSAVSLFTLESLVINESSTHVVEPLFSSLLIYLAEPKVICPSVSVRWYIGRDCSCLRQQTSNHDDCNCGLVCWLIFCVCLSLVLWETKCLLSCEAFKTFFGELDIKGAHNSGASCCLRLCPSFMELKVAKYTVRPQVQVFLTNSLYCYPMLCVLPH